MRYRILLSAFFEVRWHRLRAGQPRFLLDLLENLLVRSHVQIQRRRSLCLRYESRACRRVCICPRACCRLGCYDSLAHSEEKKRGGTQNSAGGIRLLTRTACEIRVRVLYPVWLLPDFFPEAYTSRS